MYITSADWMPRNFHRRVEVMVPMEDPVLRGRLQEILNIQILDTAKSWRLQSDGSYVRVQPKAGQAPRALPGPLHGNDARQGEGRRRLGAPIDPLPPELIGADHRLRREHSGRARSSPSPAERAKGS